MAWEFIHGPLAENPHRVGTPLLEPLAPQYSARRGEYRVLYLTVPVGQDARARASSLSAS